MEERNSSSQSINCFKCEYIGCNLKFERKCSLINHFKSHFSAGKPSSKFYCDNPSCNKVFCSIEHLNIHKHKFKCSYLKLVTSISTPEDQNIHKSVNEEFLQKLNNETGRKNITDYKLEAKEDKKCELEGCNQFIIKETDESAKAKSMRYTSCRKFKCSKCTKVFLRKSTLYVHERIHLEKKPFTCPFPGCIRGFTQRSNLTSHFRTNHKMMPIEENNNINEDLSPTFNFSAYRDPIYEAFMINIEKIILRFSNYY